MKNFIVGALFALCLAGAYKLGLADTAPLAFGVTADSNSNASTVVYRNAAGAVDTINISTPTFTGGAVLAIKTKAFFDTNVPAVLGQTYLCSNCTIAYSVCTSTGAGHIGDYKVSHSATVGCGTNN